uniref:ABC transporter domain-containing protein n=2 Tax=Setaria TaxID=4554 RepID=K3XSZ2_SETIT
MGSQHRGEALGTRNWTGAHRRRRISDYSGSSEVLVMDGMEGGKGATVPGEAGVAYKGEEQRGHRPRWPIQMSTASAGQCILWNGHAITSLGMFQQYKLQLNWISLKDAIKEKLTVLKNVQWLELLEGKDGSSAGPTIELMGLGRLMNEKSRAASHRLPMWLLDEPSIVKDVEGTRLLEYIIAEHWKKGGIVFVAMHLPIEIEDSMSLRLPQRFPQRKTLVDLVH